MKNLTRSVAAATRLHVDPVGGVWLDTDVGEHDGLCIGVGDTERDAIQDAIAELRARVADLEAALGQSGRQRRRVKR